MLRHAALDALQIRPPADKCRATGTIDHDTACDCDEVIDCEGQLPGRPPQPELVHPTRLPKRSMSSPGGRAILIHAIAHIEFNAINLALDIVWRFPGMPRAFYVDWIKVAQEEARHFSLLAGHLATLGHAYGDFPAHNGLWEMAEKTSGDLLARLALVPRTLEARGLDTSPAIRNKLWQSGDLRGAEILDLILADEIGHVATGNRWYRYLCQRQSLDPVEVYQDLARSYDAPRLRGPFNLEARRAAGFDETELAALEAAVAD